MLGVMDKFCPFQNQTNFLLTVSLPNLEYVKYDFVMLSYFLPV